MRLCREIVSARTKNRPMRPILDMIHSLSFRTMNYIERPSATHLARGLRKNVSTHLGFLQRIDRSRNPVQIARPSPNEFHDLLDDRRTKRRQIRVSFRAKAGEGGDGLGMGEVVDREDAHARGVLFEHAKGPVIVRGEYKGGDAGCIMQWSGRDDREEGKEKMLYESAQLTVEEDSSAKREGSGRDVIR
jgi:hypothetical protein